MPGVVGLVDVKGWFRWSGIGGLRKDWRMFVQHVIQDASPMALISFASATVDPLLAPTFRETHVNHWPFEFLIFQQQNSISYSDAMPLPGQFVFPA